MKVYFFDKGRFERWYIYIYVSKKQRTVLSSRHMTFYTMHTGNCADGDVRLSKEVKWEGRLEICSNGRWGRVHGDQWTPQNTKVVCTYLGYESGTGNDFTQLYLPILQALSKTIIFMHSVIL